MDSGEVDTVAATAAETTLHYGDYISLFASEVKGFMSNNTSSSTHNSLRAVSGASINDTRVKEFQECVFELLAPNKYKARRALEKALQQAMDKGKEGRPLKREEVLASASSYDGLPELLEAAEVEEADNRLEQMRRHGDELLYGQGVQLRHVHSKRNVHVSTTTTSKLEPSNMRVVLQEADARTAWLKIAPRFKVRADGDPIRDSDQVKVESLATAGQFLHCSVDAQTKLGMREDLAENEVHEINASVTASSFTIRIYKQAPENPLDVGVHIDGGDIVQFFHKETGSYMAAEGSFTEEPSSEGLVEDVHLRIRAPDPARPSRKEPPTSAVSFWVLERDEVVSGDPIKWLNKVRFKHVTTQLYLSLSLEQRPGDSDAEMPGFEEVDASLGRNSTVRRGTTLSTAAAGGERRYASKLVAIPDDSTVFKLHPVIRNEGEYVIDDTYTRVQHAQTGAWLSAEGENPFVRKKIASPHEEAPGRLGLPGEFKPLLDAVKDVVWDKADLIHLGFSARPQFDDAFIINRVLDEQVANVNYVKGMLPILRQYLSDRAKKTPITLLYASTVEQALNNLTSFVYHNGQPQKKRQKLFRDFKVTEMIVDILRINLDRFNPVSGVSLDRLKENSVANRTSMMVCDAASAVLDAYLDGDSRKNELYMSRHLPFFQYLFGSDIKMEEMYTELIKDNMQLVKCIGEREVKKVVKLLASDKNPDYLAFLGVLCECEEQPMGDNQEMVARILLEESRGLVYLTEVNQERNGVVVSTDGGNSWLSMESFGAAGKDERRAPREYKFLVAQLELFGQLCLGRNTHCIDLITQRLHYLTWDECFLCAKSSGLPKNLRAKYVELIANLFVDVGDNVDILADIKLDYSWTALAEVPYHDAAEDRSQALSGAVLKIFPSLAAWIATQLESNTEMVAQDKPNNIMLAEVLSLLWMLIRFGYYVHPDDLSKTVEPLVSMLNGFNDMEARGGGGGNRSVGFDLTQGTSFVSRDRPKKADSLLKWRTKLRYEANEYNVLIMRAKLMALNCVNSIFNLITTIRIQLLMWDFKGITTWGTQGELARKSMVNRNRRNAGNYNEILKKLEKFHGDIDDDESHDLYQHTHDTRSYIRGIVAKSNFITPDWYVMMGMRTHGQEDKSLPEVLLDLGKYEDPELLMASFELFQRIYTATDNMFHYAVDAQVLINAKSISLANFLERKIPLFRRQAARPIMHDEEAELVTMFNRLAHACELPDEPGAPHGMNQNIIKNSRVHLIILGMLKREDLSPEILAPMFELLRKLIRGNPSLQMLLFHHLDVILETEGTAHGWEDKMGECIEEIFNSNRDTCLQVTAGHVDKIVEIIAKQGKHVPSMLDALAAVIKLEDLNIPLKRNQDLIIKALMKHRNDVIAIAYIDDQSSPEVNAKRTDLLRGDGTVNDNTDRKLLEYHLALVELLSGCAEGENEFIESVLQTVFSVPELIGVLCDEQILADRKSAYLRFLLWVYLNTGAGPSIDNGTIHLKTDEDLFAAMEHIAEQKLGALADSLDGTTPAGEEDLDYVFNSYIPCLSVIAKSYFAPSEFPAATARMRRTTEIMETVSRKLLPTVFDRADIKTLCGCFVNIESRLPNTVTQSFMAQLTSKLTSADANIMESPAQVAYRKEYESELSLNASFNRYISNLEAIYHGKNEVETQLHHVARIRHLNKHDREEDYCEGPEEDEALVLGEYFQALVNVFVETPKNGPPVIHTEDLRVIVKQFEVSTSLGSTLTPEGLERQHVVNCTLLRAVRAILHNIDIMYEEDSEVLVPYQDEIANTGMILPVTDFMNSISDDVAREALALLCIILKGGNKCAQKQLEKYFLETREETFFQDVTNRLNNARNSALQNRVLKRQLAEEKERQKKMLGTLTLASKAGIDRNALKDDTPRHEKEEGDDMTIRVRDEGNIELTFRLLQLMCEGHNIVIKAYLHEQPDNMRSLDLVAETVTFLDMAIQEIDEDNIDLLIQSFESLVEFAQGEVKNQSAIFDAHVIDSVNRVLRTRDFGNIPLGTIYAFRQAAAQLILAMLEDQTEDTAKMAAELEDTLDIKEVFAMIYLMYKESKDEDKCDQIDEEEDEPTAEDVGYDWFSVLARLEDFTLKDYTKSQFMVADDKAKEKLKAYEHFHKMDTTIEIVRDGRIIKVHFPGAEWKQYLRGEVKEALQWKVDRTSPGDKIRSFVEESRTIIADILYEKRQVHSSMIAGFLIRGHSTWRTSLLLITAIINLMIISTWSAKQDYNDEFPNTFAGYDGALIILGAFHLIATLLVATSHWIIRPPSIIPVIESIPYLPDTLQALQLYSPQEGHAANQTKISILSFDSIYYSCLIIFSVLGLFTDGYLYSLHLLHIVSGNDTLQRVVQAVTKNGRSLLWVALLMIIVIYQYSLWAFAFYRKAFDPAEGAYCSTEWQCFITSLRLGMMSGGGLGEALPLPNIYGFDEPGIKTIFDLSFFIIITTIGMNVVFGIIVDTFSELRDEKYAVEEAMKSECFICSIKAYEFEKNGNGFDHHIKHEHNIWNYVYFMLHLDDKDPTDYNSNENYFNEKIINDQYDVFPVNRALTLQDGQGSGEFEDNVLEMLESLIGRMDKYEKDMEAEKDAREEHRRNRAARLAARVRARTMTNGGAGAGGPGASTEGFTSGDDLEY